MPDTQKQRRTQSLVLKIALFATGCAGIVAEFVLSTLATYLIGNAIFQWTIVMSIMLFAMGVGSRVSRIFKVHLLDTFICIEFILSILCAMSASVAYGLAIHTNLTPLIIYCLSFLIGLLIGLEIPIVTRLNSSYEDLRVNIADVMEKDYLGSLFGGLIFAFVCLPYLGLTYTPIVLGCINFLVASYLLFKFKYLINFKNIMITAFIFSFSFLIVFGFYADNIITYGEQSKYKDKVILSKQTPYQKLVMTQWKDFYWLYINGQEQFSTFDEEKYHEPLVHPALNLTRNAESVLILGGGDGLALREVLKYKNVKKVTLVDLDSVMTQLASNHPVLTHINNHSFLDPRVNVKNQDAFHFLDQNVNLYGVIIVDLPDPDSIDLMHVYSLNFYTLLKKHLIKDGVLVTQATSPYFAKDAFLCILKTVKKAGFTTLPYHNQIPTMGEWGWVIGVNNIKLQEKDLKTIVNNFEFSHVETKFINKNAMISMTHFGKGVVEDDGLNQIKYNTELNPVLYGYYLKGSWGIY